MGRDADWNEATSIQDRLEIQGHMPAPASGRRLNGRRGKNSPNGYLRTVVDTLMASASLQRPALSRRVGLPIHAVSDLLADLESRGFVQVTGAHGGMPGRSRLSYALRADAALAMGFDIGGTKIASALCDMRGKLLAEHTEPTSRNGADELVSQLAAIADRLCSQSGQPRFRVRNTVIGVPAAIDQSGRASLAGNLPGIEDVDLLPPLAQALGGSVVLDNDVNLALVAEAMGHPPDTMQNTAFVALGTGIGGALMVHGQLLRGAHGGAGEMGYLPLWQSAGNGWTTLEDQVGEAGIRRRYVAAGGSSRMSVQDIFAAARAGEQAALDIIEETAGFVAQGVVSILSLLDVELLVFGGSIGAREELIERVRHHVSRAWPRPVTMRRSETGGRAGLLGGVELARRHMLSGLFGPA